ncbi:MAG: hypothetical protein MK240_05645 [Opitutales bacterium]|nr:hypothetical protein [Opitutales bacterium]
MKRLLALLLLIISVSCQPGSQSPTDAFRSFEQAWKSGDTASLDSMVDADTRKYFKSLQPWIIVGNEESLVSLNSFDRYLLFLIRIHLDYLDDSDWERWLYRLQSGDSFNALDDYLLGLLEESFFRTSLGEVDSYAGVTAGVLYRMGTDTGLRIRFKKEGTWKVDLKNFFQNQFQGELKPFLSDRYKNRDRVWEMLKEKYGDRMSFELRRSRVARKDTDTTN